MAADHLTPGEIEADDFVLIEPRSGKTRQRPGIDMSVVETVMAGDEAGQHAGIRRVHLTGDQREADPRDRLHPEHAQHRHVGVAGAGQDDVLDHGMVHALHASLSSTAIESSAVTRMSSTATSSLNSEIAAST